MEMHRISKKNTCLLTSVNIVNSDRNVVQLKMYVFKDKCVPIKIGLLGFWYSYLVFFPLLKYGAVFAATYHLPVKDDATEAAHEKRTKTPCA